MRAGDDGKREKGLSSFFSLPIVPGRFLFFSFQPPYDTKRPMISRGESFHGVRTYQYKPTSISSHHHTGIELNFKRRRVEKSDFYLTENIQLILQNKNDGSRLDFSYYK